MSEALNPTPVLEELLRLPIGVALGPTHADRLAQIGALELFEAGREIFAMGEPAEALRIVLEGRVGLELPMPGRAAMLVAALSRGDMLGWSALRRSSSRWTATARATKTARCLAFPAAEVRELCELDHELGYTLMRHAFEVVALRLSDCRGRLLDLYGAPEEGGP